MGKDMLADWIGRSTEAHDIVTAGPVARLAATLGHDGKHWPADVLPPLGHWLFHLPDTLRDGLGADGHPKRGGLLPPIWYPRRMWAGGRLTFHAPVPIDAILHKQTTIAAIDEKGAMTLVTLRHVLSAGAAVAVEEEQDLAYLPIAAPGPPRRVDRPTPHLTRTMMADEALLFRFSALTFNAHRIHYDARYARTVEHYPALVVHGPLQAILLMDLALESGVVPTRFAFRARAPLYVGQRFTLALAGTSTGSQLWIVDERGDITMTAEVERNPPA